MKTFLKNLELLNIIKILSLSIIIFFWDLRVKGFDSRLLIFFLAFLFIFDFKLIFSNKNKKSFYYGLLIIFFIILHYYFNIILDNQSVLFISKEITYIFISYFVIFFNLYLIRKYLRLILLFFIFCFFISTMIFFLKNSHYFKIDMSCTYNGGWHGNTRFFFSENSHLSMMSVSVIIYYLLGSHFSKLLIPEKILFFLFFLISVINYSLTFLAGIITSIFSLFLSNGKVFNKNIIIKSTFLLVLSSFFLFLDSACSSKIFKTQAAITNQKEGSVLGLSAAVFMNSVNFAKTTILERPFGWGINRYELAYRKYAIIEKSNYNLKEYHRYLFKWNLNMQDASNNFSKIVTEFGVFSLIIFLYFIYFSFSSKSSFQEKTFLIPLVLTQLFRGAGYFNGGFILCVLLMLAITLSKRHD